MVFSTQQQMYDKVEAIPYLKVGLVLGTSNRNKNGSENKFFSQRIRTTFNLWKAGKIDEIIVSGDNRTRYYNEPLMMQKALENLGVPHHKILLDTAGYRTIESIKNAETKFGLDEFTIITQQFHGYRALFISNHYKLHAQVMQTPGLPLKVSGNVRLREFFARIKAFFELYIRKE